MSNKQLLIEYSLFTPNTTQLRESKLNSRQPFLVSGKIQAADKPNANKRIYDYDTLKKQVSLYEQGPIAEKRALGELDHPETSVINLKNVCHNITRVWWEGKDLYGEFEILNTPSGNILKELFFAGIKVGVSSRAMGSVTPIGEGLVQVGEDLELLCFDFVSTPSTYGAYVSPVGGLNESYQYIAPANTKYNKVNSIISDLICSQSGICCIR